MSAINDALRRASGAGAGTSEPPPLPSAGAASLPPFLTEPSAVPLAMSDGLSPLVEPEPEKKSALPIIFLVVLLFGAAGGAGYYLWKRSQDAAAAAKLPDVRQIAAQPDAQKQPATPATATDKATAPAPTASTPAAAVALAKSAVPATAPSANVPPATPRPPVQFPPLRLQGIYFRPSNPSVMINNKTLFLNDQIQGVTVAAIEQASVTLVLSGQTNILTLR